MHAVTLADRDLLAITSDTDPTRAMRVDFPVSTADGACASAVVYFELDPGCRCGVHTDSAEEIVYIASGTVEATIGEERGVLAAGSVGLVPALVPHDVVNVGEEVARVIGFFASATVVSVFEDPLMPIGKRVVGTPQPEDDLAPIVA